jgi:hypothetical protein
MSDRYFEQAQDLEFAGREPLPLDFGNAPGLAIAYLLAAGLMEIFGPLFWMALIMLFLFAEL